MKSSAILKIGIMGIIVLIVSISGCTTSSTTKTFSDGVMSFDYPDDYKNTTYSTKANPISHMQRIGKLKNNYTLTILVGKNVSATSPTALRNRSISKINNESNSAILSQNTEKNINGIVIEKITYKYPSLPFGIMIQYEDMYFQTNGTVYAISVYGPDFFNQSITNTTNIIFQSIR